ncbi:MAG: hypothetical protein IJV96_08140 [Clostridia bacterium]|nr:hypothetical protein [Clostridia bacterium]
MKKTVKIVALALVLVMALGLLASCGGVERGEYVSEKGYTYEFSGNRYTYTMDKVVLKGTYTIKDVDGDKMIICEIKERFVDGKEIEFGEDDKESDRYIGSKTGVKFIEGDGYIVVGTTKYTKR